MRLLSRLLPPRFQAVSNWRTGVVFGTLASLPFLETLLYNAHVGPGRPVLKPVEYLQIALLFVILWALMVLSFIVERPALQALQESLRHQSRKIRRIIARQSVRLLYLLPVTFLVLFFFGDLGSESMRELARQVLPLFAFAGLAIQLAAAILLIWLISWLVGATVPPGDLSDTINRWALGIRLTAMFYLVLIASTWKLVSADGIQEPMRANYVMAIGKDYLLMFIIVDMLFIGVFRLGDARKLAAVFQSVRGFIHFMIVCAVVAILAIWASFNSLGSDNLAATYGARPNWQWQYNRAHVYLREIGLLLMPIAGLLFWALNKVGEELRTRQPETLGTSD